MTGQASHVYVSASSQDSRDTSRQGHTVALTPETVAALDRAEPGQSLRVIKQVNLPGEQTTVIARASVYTTPKPRVMTVADVNRELAKTSRTDPPTFIGVVADMGYPTAETPAVQVPAVEDSDGDETTAWPVEQEGDTRA